LLASKVRGVLNGHSLLKSIFGEIRYEKGTRGFGSSSSVKPG
jgi:hypothetical protein